MSKKIGTIHVKDWEHAPQGMDQIDDYVEFIRDAAQHLLEPNDGAHFVMVIGALVTVAGEMLHCIEEKDRGHFVEHCQDTIMIEAKGVTR